MDRALFANFDTPELGPALRWRCEPERWCVEPEHGRLVVWPSAGTDYWQRTHYGFEADNGHFLHLRATGDFVLTTKVTGFPAHQFDQAGLMLRLSPACWLKTSVEFEPEGDNRLGAVVTNQGYSDWSTQPVAKGVATFWFRVRAEGNDCIVDASLDGETFQQLRMAHLAERGSSAHVDCGLYACSPKSSGYRAEFDFLRFEPGRRP